MINLQADILPGLTAPADTAKVAKAAEGLAELKSLSLNDLLERLASSAVTFCINLAIALIVFYLGRFIISKIYKVLSSIFTRRHVDKSLATFVLSLVNIVLYFILLVTVIGILGIETTSFLAIFASAGVAIGMALSGTLQNFAGGVLILLLKPYKIGDYIEVQGYAGTVKEIQIFFTVITTYDNKSISIPNGGLSTGSVNNWSREPVRRVSWNVSIAYGDNVEDARKAILAMFEGDERIKTDTPPSVLLSELNTSSVDLQIRAWTDTSLYWPVFYEYIERFYNELPKHGLHFPFPQLDVHLPETVQVQNSADSAAALAPEAGK